MTTSPAIESSEIALTAPGVEGAARAAFAGAATALDAATRLGRTATGLEYTLRHVRFNPAEEARCRCELW